MKEFDTLDFHIGRNVIITSVEADHAFGTIMYKIKDKWAVAITDIIGGREYRDCVLCDEKDLATLGYFSNMDLLLAQTHEKTLKEYKEKINELKRIRE